MFSKNWKFATKNKSGTAQIDDIGDMRATSKRAAPVFSQLSGNERNKSVRKSDEGKRTTRPGVPAKRVPHTDADETSLCRIVYGEHNCEC